MVHYLGGKDTEGMVGAGMRLSGKGCVQGVGWGKSVLRVWGGRGLLRDDYYEGS